MIIDVDGVNPPLINKYTLSIKDQYIRIKTKDETMYIPWHKINYLKIIENNKQR